MFLEFQSFSPYIFGLITQTSPLQQFLCCAGQKELAASIPRS